jgi:hypothetical protein
MDRQIVVRTLFIKKILVFTKQAKKNEGNNKEKCARQEKKDIMSDKRNKNKER